MLSFSLVSFMSYKLHRMTQRWLELTNMPSQRFSAFRLPFFSRNGLGIGARSHVALNAAVFRCARHSQAFPLRKRAQNREVNIHQTEIAAGTRSRNKPRKWFQMAIDDDISHDSNVCERMKWIIYSTRSSSFLRTALS